MGVDLSTCGCVLIKLSPEKSRGKEGDIIKHLLILADKKHSHECKTRSAKNKCECDIIAISSLTGYYDYFIIVKVNGISDLEQFVINCLRNGSFGHVIQETQTLAGLLHYHK